MTAVERPQLGGKTWGEDITKYGGIGALPLFGKVKVKDLPVARSHRHFGSGIDNFKADLQPHEVTSLRLSECRQNDQLLPPVGTVTIEPEKCHVGPILQDHPYATHIERSEIFARGPSEDGKQGKSPLGEATLNALAEYRRKLYSDTTYGVSFSKPRPQSDGQVTSEPIPIRHDGSPLRPILAKTNEVGKLSKRVRFLENASDGQTTLKEKSNKILIGGLSPCWPPSAYLFGKTWQIKEDLERFPRKTSNGSDQVRVPKEGPLKNGSDVTREPAPDSGTANHICPAIMCKNSLCGKPLGSLGPDYEEASLCERWARFEAWKDRLRLAEWRLPKLPEMPTPRGDLHCPDREFYFDEKDENEEERRKADDGNDVTDEDKTPEEILQTMCTAHLRLPRQPFRRNPLFERTELRKIPLPPVHLSDCLLHSGNRIPCKLGLRFKTEAYKRYHALHPESVPDLRKPHNERKRYFFYGYHATSYRD